MCLKKKEGIKCCKKPVIFLDSPQKLQQLR